MNVRWRDSGQQSNTNKHKSFFVTCYVSIFDIVWAQFILHQINKSL